MKLKNIAFLLLLVASSAFANEVGTANQVMRIPSGGGRGQYGAVDLSSSAAVTNALPVTKGGTGLSSAGSAYQVLRNSSGGTLGLGAIDITQSAAVTGILPLANGGTNRPSFLPPTVQRFTSGSGTYNLDYTFVITSGSATVGATYTNNAVTFTVYSTVASATLVVMSGSGAPASSGTLTKASGTGDSTLTFSQAIAPLYLDVRLVGGGGAGGSAGTGSPATGGAGGTSSFGSSLLTVGAGSGGPFNGDGGAGSSTCTVNSPAVKLVAALGSTGSGSDFVPSSGAGGAGGPSPFGGAGGGGSFSGNNGLDAKTNSGSGGGGAVGSSTSQSGAGGGAGCYVEALINSPSATYAYVVGAGGSAGAGSFPGGVGGSGLIVVTEHYQ